MPYPPKSRRTLTRPKAANSSMMCSESIAGRAARRRAPSRDFGGVFGGRRERDRFAAAAGRGLVRIVEHESGRQLVDLEVHLGAEQEEHGLGIDQQLDALVLDHLVARMRALGIFHGV